MLSAKSLRSFALAVAIATASLSCATSKMVQKVIEPTPPVNAATELLEYCAGDANYNGPAMSPRSCENPEHIDFEHLPVTVSAYPDVQGLTIAAISVWNDWMGFELFKYSHLDSEADIIVMNSGVDDEERGIRAYAQHYQWDQRWRSLITIHNVAMDSVDTMSHELGHAIGLDHDPDNIRSIMYPNSGRHVPWLEDIDKTLIREIYASYSTR